MSEPNKICNSEYEIVTEGLCPEDFASLLTGMVPHIRHAILTQNKNIAKVVLAKNIPGTLRVKLSIEFDGPLALGPLIMSRDKLVVN